MKAKAKRTRATKCPTCGRKYLLQEERENIKDVGECSICSYKRAYNESLQDANEPTLEDLVSDLIKLSDDHNKRLTDLLGKLL